MHPLQRTGLTAVVLGALGAGFVAGTAFDGPAADPGRPAQKEELRLVNADLRPAQSCDQLLEWYVDRGVRRVTPYGWDYLRVYTLEDNAGGSPEPAEATSSATGTNVQEAGVDEPDVVKTDGSLLVRVEGGTTLVVYDVTGDAPVRVGSLPLEGVFSPELLLAGDRVVVVGREAGAAQGRIAPGTSVWVVDLADPSAPAIVQRSSYDSTLVTARQHGDVVRLVMSTSLPALDFAEPGLLRREATALERNQDVVRASSIEDWLPHVTTYGADGTDAVREQQLDCDDVAIPAADAGLGTVVVTGFDVHEPTAVDTTAVTTPSQTVYVSEDRLYLASGAYRAGWETCCWDLPQPDAGTTATDLADEGTTYLYDFELDGTAATYAASGQVRGQVASRWSMDEHDGVLRVAVGPTTQTEAANSVVTFSRTGAELTEIGRVDGLGPGEDIKAVRWFDGLAVVVTFRQTDPFYAVDLTDPEDPVLVGELKIPGFSSYLHPVGDDLMIGVGSDADAETGAVRGAKVSLYDVSDLGAPREVETVTYAPGSTAHAGLDPRQFTWLPDRRTALTVVSSGWGVDTSVAVLHVGEGSMTSELVDVTVQEDPAGVRLVPLPDGRVLLVTAYDVSFFDV